MYDSIGLFNFLRIVLLLNAAVAIALATDLLGFLPNLSYFSAASISVMAVSALLFFIGQTPLFPWLCGLPVIWRLFPNIDGTYEVEVSSNWSILKVRNEDRNPEVSADGDAKLFKRMGKAKITSRLTRIDMRITMDDEYLTSETVICSLQRERGARFPTLFYIYESHVATPKNTDSQRHLGAARVSIPLERRPTVLEGNYWTDRNWHQGLNTAGQIRLRQT